MIKLFNIMKVSKNIFKKIINFKIYLLFLIIFSFKISANQNNFEFEISGNINTDREVISTIIDTMPDNIDDEFSNYLLKELNNTGLFKDIKIRLVNNKYFIDVIEYPVIQKIYFNGNERFKDEELNQFVDELNFNIYNKSNIKIFISELNSIYSSFGYNDIKIDLTEDISDQNLATIYLDITENKITNIKSIKFIGNMNINSLDLEDVIKSKVRKLTNIFANNNFKPMQVDTDRQRLLNFYKEKGYADIQVNYNIEFFDNNTVIIYFNINEGNAYEVGEIKYLNNSQDNNINDILDNYFETNNFVNSIYNISLAENIEKDLSDIIKNSGMQFFEINKRVKLNINKADLLFEINSSNPIYINNINISGNTRTQDYVIRRELDISEGDALLLNDTNVIRKQINSLGFFENVEVTKTNLDGNLVNIDINIKENQTGSFTAGASFGTLDGISLATGLNESNIAGTGRKVEFTFNNSDKNSEYKFNTTDRFFLNQNVDLTYGLSFKESDFSKSSSYEKDNYKLSSGISYEFQDNLYHTVTLSYELDDILITDASTASSTIKDVEGGSVKFLLENGITYNTLNSLLFPRNGNYMRFSNVIETPSSSKNGYFKNTVTLKKYKEFKNDIASFQVMIGNIISLNDSDILPNDKYSLGGRWLRGFDNYGAGPRDSRTSYIGGNNILATKVDYSKLLFENDDNPIYFNIFNDIGIVWDNRTTPTHSEESIRSSAGFGIKFYSFIGPIAFTWGFPIQDESYDIKRMFTFSLGNIN